MQMYEQYFSVGSPTFNPMTGNKVQGNTIGVDFNGTSQPNLGPLGGLGGGVFGIHISANIVTQTFSSNLIGVDYSAATPNLNQGNLIGNHSIAINLTRANNGGAPGDSNQINGNKLGISAVPPPAMLVTQLVSILVAASPTQLYGATFWRAATLLQLLMYMASLLLGHYKH